MIRSKLRMHRDTHQSTLTTRLDIGYHKQGLSSQLSIFKYSDATRSFRKKHSSVRRPGDRPNDFQVWNNSFNPECGLRISRGFDFANATTGWRMTARKRQQRDEASYGINWTCHLPFLIFHFAITPSIT